MQLFTPVLTDEHDILQRLSQRIKLRCLKFRFTPYTSQRNVNKWCVIILVCAVGHIPFTCMCLRCLCLAYPTIRYEYT